MTTYDAVHFYCRDNQINVALFIIEDDLEITEIGVASAFGLTLCSKRDCKKSLTEQG